MMKYPCGTCSPYIQVQLVVRWSYQMATLFNIFVSQAANHSLSDFVVGYFLLDLTSSENWQLISSSSAFQVANCRKQNYRIETVEHSIVHIQLNDKSFIVLKSWFFYFLDFNKSLSLLKQIFAVCATYFNLTKCSSNTFMCDTADRNTFFVHAAEPHLCLLQRSN